MAIIRRSTTLVAVAATTMLVGGTQLGQAALGAPSHAAAHASHSRTEKVIVVLRDQLAATPVSRLHMQARTNRAASSQAAVLGRLTGRVPTHVRHFSVGNAFAATVTVAQAAELAADPAVASVVKDTKISAQPTTAATPIGKQPKASKVQPAAVSADGPDAICPSDPSAPLIEPEALRTIHALTTDGSPNAQQLDKGKGVRVAYIADGIDPDNPNFIRPNGKHAIIDYKDFSGDGPNSPTSGAEAFGDASAIAAQGTVTYDLSNFVNSNYPLPPGCNIRILGVAPAASIVAIKAGGEFLTNSSILQSIDYAVRVDHVDVINESFGLSSFPDDSSRNTVELFNDQAVAAGVVITESTGDGGVTGTIGSDSQDPLVISAGASTDSQSYAQTGYAGARFFGNGKWDDNNISALSSSGFTQLGRTIDLVAPGETDWASCEASPFFAGCTNFNGGRSDIQPFGGTSQSSPITAGVAALVISEYRKTHGGASPTPAVVKQILTGTTDDLGLPPFEQGSGLINARAAVEAAMTWPGATGTVPASVKSNIVTSPNQITLQGKPGSTKSGGFDVTNVGNHSVHVSAGTRTFQTIAESRPGGRVQLEHAADVPVPHHRRAVGAQGTPLPRARRRSTARRAHGVGRVHSAGDKIVRLTLIAPDGTYEANSRPQGGAATPNYANVDVRNPAAGTWTAVLYSLAGAAGLQRRHRVRHPVPAGHPGGPGQPGHVHPGARRVAARHVHRAHAGQGLRRPGRRDHARHVPGPADLGLGGDPVADRHVVRHRHVQRECHRRQRPWGHAGRDLQLRVRRPGQPGRPRRGACKFNHNPNSIMDVVLLDPNNELADVVTNLTPNAFGTSLSISRTIAAFEANPIAGRWHLVVVVQNPVSGTAFTEPFKGTVSFNGSARRLRTCRTTRHHAAGRRAADGQRRRHQPGPADDPGRVPTRG